MSKHYELFETISGPMVLFDDELISVHEHVRLFDVIDDNPEFLRDLKGFITDGLQYKMREMMDAFNTPSHMVMLEYVNGYLNAMRGYANLANHEYPRYRHAQQEAMKLV